MSQSRPMDDQKHVIASQEAVLELTFKANWPYPKTVNAEYSNEVMVCIGLSLKRLPGSQTSPWQITFKARIIENNSTQEMLKNENNEDRTLLIVNNGYARELVLESCQFPLNLTPSFVTLEPSVANLSADFMQDSKEEPCFNLVKDQIYRVKICYPDLNLLYRLNYNNVGPEVKVFAIKGDTREILQDHALWKVKENKSNPIRTDEVRSAKLQEIVRHYSKEELEAQERNFKFNCSYSVRFCRDNTCAINATFGWYFPHLLKFLDEFPEITGLHISCLFNLQKFVPDLARNQTLTSLTMSNCKLGPKEVHTLVADPFWTTLNISNNPIRDAGAEILAKNNTLTKVDVFECGLSDYAAIKFAENKTITDLNLGNNFIVDAGLLALAKNLTLTSIYLESGVDHVVRHRKEVVNEVQKQVQINRKRQALWMLIAVAIASERANFGSEIKRANRTSFVRILEMCDVSFSEQHKRLYYTGVGEKLSTNSSSSTTTVSVSSMPVSLVNSRSTTFSLVKTEESSSNSSSSTSASVARKTQRQRDGS